MVAEALLHRSSACARSLNWRWLSSEWATLALGAPKVLSRQLMRKSRGWVVGVVLGLALLIGRLRSDCILLLNLRLVLVLSLLVVLILVEIGIEVAACLVSSIRYRALWGMVLHLATEIVIGRLCALLIRENWLWKC